MPQGVKGFQKGQSSNPKGRARGSRNKKTLEIQEAARQIIESPTYLASLKTRLNAGKAPHMETLLFYYAYGKPTEKFEVGGANSGPVVLKVIYEDKA